MSSLVLVFLYGLVISTKKSQKKQMASRTSGDVCASLIHIPDDAFFVAASNLDERSLCASDATCRTFRRLNRALGLWRLLGLRRFEGLDIDERGTFTDPIMTDPTSCGGNRTANITTKPTPHGVRRRERTSRPRLALTQPRRWEMDWKLRFAQFAKEVYEFRSPFDPGNISMVASPDEVAYTKCRFRADILSANPHIAIYLEVDVAANADNLSLAIVDFDEGGKSSVTFSPDTGAVIRETKVQETPRRVKGAYIKPRKPNFTKFEGKVGIYVKNAMIAFFRQYTRQHWESTGFCVDFTWARGKRLTPCLAFRDEGKYLTRIVKVSSEPPFEPRSHDDAFNNARWNELNWEGGAAM
eukprot:GEMP01025516.1.p1 GENE.GEMP01025516.1~~GEMP01025516.1.p1  ORF type:complete len:355 (+),score=100.50 GEMP01025516.1:436-1500(+)